MRSRPGCAKPDPQPYLVIRGSGSRGADDQGDSTGRFVVVSESDEPDPGSDGEFFDSAGDVGFGWSDWPVIPGREFVSVFKAAARCSEVRSVSTLFFNSVNMLSMGP